MKRPQVKTDKPRSFAKKIGDEHARPIIFTLTPPPLGASDTDVYKRTDFLKTLQGSLAIDAINLPEVRDESRKRRITPFVPKWEPREFAKIVQQEPWFEPEIIVDRGIVHTHWANQRAWLRKSIRDFGLQNLVLVGGESSNRRYPGPPVTEAARRISNELGEQLFLGGITIPSRQDEAARLVEKSESGIQFFISQVIFEAAPAQKLLREYHQACQRTNMTTRRVFLSFAPASSKKEIEFLRWWDVVIPSACERKLLRGSGDMLSRSVAICSEIFAEVAWFVRDNEIDVPLGLNIEHVSMRNLEGSQDLATHLARLYK